MSRLQSFPPLMPFLLPNGGMVFSRDMTYRALCTLCLLLLGHAIFGVSPIHSGGKAKPVVVVFDVLTTPGEPVQLQAHVYEGSLLGREVGLGGETVEFLVEKQVVGTTMTGGDGRAFLEYAPRMRGNFSITVRVLESPRVLSAKGSGLLASWERKKPILLIDMVAVIQEKQDPEIPVPSFPINFSSTGLGDPEADAPNELEKLGRFYYNLLYLYRSEAGNKKHLQEWIRKNQFPSGFPKIIPGGRDALEEFINKLEKAGWANVTGGIGRTAEFAEVFVEHRLKAVILHNPEDREGFPRRAILVEGWDKVRRHL
jgi:hypothetical protein